MRLGPGALGAAVLCGALLGAVAPAASSAATIRAGALEAGVSGALVSRGSTAITLSARLGRFWGDDGRARPVRNLFALELATVYSHVRELDSVDLLGATTWSRPVGCGRWVPFAGVLGGIRREWLGSFRESRFPVGGVVGVRAVTGPHSAFRAEYQHLRILGDPSGDRSEHQVLFGLSLLLRND